MSANARSSTSIASPFLYVPSTAPLYIPSWRACSLLPFAHVGPSYLQMYKVPPVENETLQSYGAQSVERPKLTAAIKKLRSQQPVEVPLVINGQEIKSSSKADQLNPSDKSVLAECWQASADHIQLAIEGALKAKVAWEAMAFHDRAAIFLKAADLLSTKYRYEVMAATMLGQGKNAWQAEIDAAAELVDFWRFNCKYAEELYAVQPARNAQGVWNRTEYRPLEGFVYAIAPFNFTAIAGNLSGAPALMGNVVLLKPSPSAAYSNYLVMKIFLEAGLPPGVIQFVPGPAEEITEAVLQSRHFASLHYTGSTAVFKSLYQKIAQNLDRYVTYPRIVGETGGKNFHVVHKSADLENAVVNTVRGAFEYQGQKCSACSRLYISASLWPDFQRRMLEEIAKIKVGSPENYENFMGPVIHQAAFDRLKTAIDGAEKSGQECIALGRCDDSKGFFVEPTVIVTKDPKHEVLTRELFGPVLGVYVFEDEDFEPTLDLVDSATAYGLTGSIFAKDRSIVSMALKRLQNAAGNFYINDKCTGAVVSQQPFGGARASGTNDKAGSMSLLWRFVSMRSIKENMIDAESVLYPSNES